MAFAGLHLLRVVPSVYCPMASGPGFLGYFCLASGDRVFVFVNEIYSQRYVSFPPVIKFGLKPRVWCMERLVLPGILRGG